MKSKLLNGLMACAALLLIGVRPAAGIPQQRELENPITVLDALQEGEASFTAPEASAFVRELIPLVERVTERRFKTVPECRLVGRGAMAGILARDLIPQFRNLMPGIPENQIQSEAQAQARLFSLLLFGKYGFEDKVLYLMPRNVTPLLDLIGIEEKYTESIVKIIVAHELAHALQDQHTGLAKRVLHIDSIEESQAFNATIEGHAVFVQDQVGRALGLDEAVLKTSRLFAAGAVKLKDPGLEMINKLISTQFEQIYLGGRKFIEHHYRKGGNRAVWAILISPPVRTSMISKPWTYAPTRKKSIDYAGLFKGLEKDFGPTRWAVRNMELGEMMLRSVYANMEQKKREAILSNLVHVQAFVVSSNLPQSMGNVSIFILRDRELGPVMIRTLEDMAKMNMEKMKASALFALENFTLQDFPGIKADLSRVVSFTLKMATGIAQKQVIVRVLRGNVLVEMADMGIGLEKEQLAAIAEKVFQRYEKAAKGMKGD